MRNSTISLFAITVAPLILASAAFSSDVTPAVLSSGNGRYVFGQINGMARDQYMLDTKTGRLWSMGADKGTGRVSLTPVPYRINNHEDVMSEDARAEMIKDSASVDMDAWPKQIKSTYIRALLGLDENTPIGADADPKTDDKAPPVATPNQKDPFKDLVESLPPVHVSPEPKK